jgi:hypothetical protein
LRAAILLPAAIRFIIFWDIVCMVYFFVVKNISPKDKIQRVKLTKAKGLSSSKRAANKNKFVVPKIATSTITEFVSKFFILVFLVG